jgi:uncharacterized sulfatase
MKNIKSHLKQCRKLLNILSVCIFALNCTTSFAQDKPDLVIVLGDDHGVFDSSAYGATEMHTPNMLAMAKEGMQFNRAYVASPSCGPSRAALATGLMPLRNGVIGNHENTRLKKDVKGLYQNLIDAGYDVVFKGKIAHGKSKKTRYLSDKITYLDGAQKKMKLGNVDAYLAARTEKSQPIALFIGPTDTHTKWPKASEARISPNDVVFPQRTKVDTAETRTILTRYVQAVENVDHVLGGVRNLINKHLDPQNTLLIYSSDHGMNWPFGKWSLYETGIRTPLLVVWPGKVKANVKTDAMVSWVDILPTLLDVADGKPGEDIDGKSFKNVLFGKTETHRNLVFASHKGDNGQNVYPSRSVRNDKFKYILNLHPEFLNTTHIDVKDVFKQREFEKKNPHRLEHWDSVALAAKEDQLAGQFMLDYRTNPAEELYLVNEDKYEKVNLAFDPRYQTVLIELRAHVSNRMKALNDNGALDQELSGAPRFIKGYNFAPALKLYYPIGNEVLKANSQATIHWNNSWQGTKTVKIEYYNGVKWHVITSKTPHSGSYEWTVPQLKSTKIKIRISANNGRIFDESDNSFTVN